MNTRLSFKIILSLVILMTSGVVHAGDFGAHRRKIKKIENQIHLLDDELEKKIEVKNTTRDQARIEETLQRIVEIHAELISHRRELDEVIDHVREEHKEQGEKANMFHDVKDRLAVEKRKRMMDPLQLRLDEMLRRIQSKYASMVNQKLESEEIQEVERVLKKKKKKRQEKESREYLRRKSKVKLVK